MGEESRQKQTGNTLAKAASGGTPTKKEARSAIKDLASRPLPNYGSAATARAGIKGLQPTNSNKPKKGGR